MKCKRKRKKKNEFKMRMQNSIVTSGENEMKQKNRFWRQPNQSMFDKCINIIGLHRRKKSEVFPNHKRVR